MYVFELTIEIDYSNIYINIYTVIHKITVKFVQPIKASVIFNYIFLTESINF